MHVLLQAFLNSAQGSPALDYHTWLHSSLLINTRPYHNKPFPWNACDSQVLQSYKPAIPQASAHRRVFLSDLPMFPASHFIHQYHPHLPPITTQSQPCALPSPSPHISIVLSAKLDPHPSIITIHQDPSSQAPSRCPQHQRHFNRHSHPITTPLRVTRTWRLY